MRSYSTSDPSLFYYQTGEKPRLLIHTGTHGDEYEVIDLAMEAVKKYEDDLPSFVFVPVVSPSAVAKRTRNNGRGIDMNREFYSDSNDKEVVANIEILENKEFDLFVSFHEDPGSSFYYIYDVKFSGREDELVLAHNKLVSDMGVGLLNGVDDPDDDFLGYEFVDGYLKLSHPEKYEDDGTVSAWVLNRRKAFEYYCPEIPGLVSLETKRKIVETFFEKVLLERYK